MLKYSFLFFQSLLSHHSTNEKKSQEFARVSDLLQGDDCELVFFLVQFVELEEIDNHIDNQCGYDKRNR